MRHPMSAHLFGGGAPTLDDVKIYLRHQWHRSRSFFRELTEFALTLTLPDAALIYRNLHQEAGGAPGATAHPILFQRLLAYLGLPADLHEPPSLPEAHAYLTNRYRCVRHEDPAWGLAVLFSLEHGAQETHGAIAALLARMGLPEHVTEFHRTHVEADAAHTADLLSLVARLVVTAEAQRTFLRSLYHHRALHKRYFDRIWSEMGGALDHEKEGDR
jgi:pyrroloquinoline quinone (PQQ) biosynthesis protein C